MAEVVVADPSDHAHTSSATGGGDGLIGPFAAVCPVELAAEDRPGVLAEVAKVFG